jgi:hypothetical protein
MRLKRDRIGGLMIRRDWGDRRPWPTNKAGDLTLLRHKTKEIIRAASLRDELNFTSFRHGGFTEAADSDLTDAEIRAKGRHRSSKMLPRYAKRTMRQVAAGQKKRRTTRTEGPFVRMNKQTACQNKETGMAQVIGTLVTPGGLEPPTNSLEGCCSIQLSYGAPTKRTM